VRHPYRASRAHSAASVSVIASRCVHRWRHHHGRTCRMRPRPRICASSWPSSSVKAGAREQALVDASTQVICACGWPKCRAR
jgi:hypothetical protein